MTDGSSGSVLFFCGPVMPAPLFLRCKLHLGADWHFNLPPLWRRFIFFNAVPAK